jgi:hypothetical protein
MTNDKWEAGHLMKTLRSREFRVDRHKQIGTAAHMSLEQVSTKGCERYRSGLEGEG